MTSPFDNADKSDNAENLDFEIIRRIQDQIDADESRGLNVSRDDDDVEICVQLLQQSASLIFFPVDGVDGAVGTPDSAEARSTENVSATADEDVHDRLSGYQGGVLLSFEFVRVLGTGGFGVVLAVRDRNRNRQYAIKILRPSLSGTSKLQKRFLREAELTSDFRHPGIVRVYGTGLLGNHPFILTELIDGLNIASLLRSHGPTLRPTAAVSLVLKVCIALRYAHEQGVLHRDLKPENVLLANHGRETEVDSCVPVLTDFGLARRIEASANDSSSHAQVVGTILYMAPELATGQRQAPGVVCDIFSLAAILYQCVTGHVPFEGKGYFEIISRMVRSPVPSARTFNPLVSPDLDFVLQKALSKNPNLRYQTAAEFEAELERFLANRPVLARQSFLVRRVKRFLTDHPRLALASGVLSVVVPVALIVISALYWRERRAVQQHREMLAMTMDSVKEYTNIAEHVLANVPASNQERYDLHWSALKAQEAVAQGLGYNAESRYRLSVQYSYLAAAAIRVNNLELSQHHRQKCLSLLRELSKEDPDNIDYLYDIFYNQKYAADEMWDGFAAEKTAAKEQSLVEIRRLREKAPINSDFEDAEASCLYGLATDYVWRKDSRAEHYLQQAIRLSEKLFNAHPDKLLYVKYAIMGRADLSSMYRESGRYAEAEQIAVQAIQIVDGIQNPEAKAVWFQLIQRQPLVAYAASLSAQKKWSEASGAWQACLAVEDSLSTHDPDNARYIAGRCCMYLELLRAHKKLGLDDSAEQEMMAEAVRRLEAFRATNRWQDDIPGIEAVLNDTDAPLPRLLQ